MLRTLALLAIALIATAQPLTAHADFKKGPPICDDVIPPDLNLKRSGDEPPDDDRCPTDDGRFFDPYIPPLPPCVPDAFTLFCKIDE